MNAGWSTYERFGRGAPSSHGFAVRIQKFRDAVILAGADEQIDFGHLLLEFLGIALRHAA